MQSWMFLILTIAGGAMVALQQPFNAGLARHIGPNWATFISFGVGTIVAAIMSLAMGNAPSLLGRISAAPWYTWIGGGICGSLLVLCFTLAVPRIGVTALIFASIAGQILMAMTLDHFGWLGIERQPIDLRRALAIPVVLLALWLVQRPAAVP